MATTKKRIPTKRIAINWRYALGEVAIVSVGIMLAFQLNSWKEQRQNAQLERQSIKMLYNEVVQDSAILYQYFKQANLHKEDAAALLKMLSAADAMPYADSIANCFRRCGFYSGNVLHRSAFMMMSAQGTINLVKNDTLRTNIYQYYDRTQKVVELWNNFEKEMVGKVVPELYKNGLIDDARVLETNGLRIFYKPDLLIEELQKPENMGRMAVYMRTQNDLVSVTNLNRRLNGELQKRLKRYIGVGED